MEKKGKYDFIQTKHIRHSHFEESLLALNETLMQFRRAGITPKEILTFYQKTMTGETIFSSRFYYDLKDKCYRLESDFPSEFEMFENLYLTEKFMIHDIK